MDEYDKKFAEMQKYIPFLEAMIERLQNVKDKSPECQLQRLQGLYGVLKNKKRKLKIETLHRCEDVLQKLHNKVEKGNSPGLQISSRRADGQSASTSEDSGMRQRKKNTKPQKVIEIVIDSSADETPASPSPTISPATNPQSSPIIIPTERSEDSKPASPEPAETVPTKAPIVIPTERENLLELLPDDSEDPGFSEWDMLEESEKQNTNKSEWDSCLPPFPDVATAVKAVSSNLPRKVNEGRPIPAIITRHIQTAPAPGLNGRRRLSSGSEQGRMTGLDTELESSSSRSDSPVNVPDIRLKSPDPDLFYSNASVSPSKGQKEASFQKVALKSCLKKPAPLLVSPPPALAEPPLSMEDIAELLNEDGGAEGTAENKEENDESKKASAGISKKDAKQSPKDTSKFETSGLIRKSIKPSANVPSTSTETERESEKRWEEIDRHIVKFSSRKSAATSESSTPTTNKVVEPKGPLSSPLCVPLSPFNVEKSADHRNKPPSPMLKEPRYADNYERHPRQHSREPQTQDAVKDRSGVSGKIGRALEEEIVPSLQSNLSLHHDSVTKPDERNTPLYQRRPQPVVDNVPFNRQIPVTGNWPPTMPPPNEFCTSWNSPGFSGIVNPPMPQVPNSYQYPMGVHPDMWNSGQAGNPMVMEPHPSNEPPLRPPFPTNINSGHRQLSGAAPCPPEINHVQRDVLQSDLPGANVSAPPNLMPMNAFPVGPKNRPYEASFDRSQEFPHNRQSWDAAQSRLNDIPYREKETCGNMPVDGPAVPPNPFVRSATPCTWNRDRNRVNDMYQNQNRSRDLYYDRGRGEPRGNFNRDARRPEWPQNVYPENNNRFNRDVRSVSERDPRMRAEHNVHSLNPTQVMPNVPTTSSSQLKPNAANSNPPKPNSNSSSVRDPRLAKDKQSQPNTFKPKEPSTSERDPRRRSSPIPKKSKYKSKNHRSPEAHKRETEANNRQSDSRISKEMMQQSPLESLYGVIDTKAGQGYISLQKFKIPKIKRPQKAQPVATDSNLPETNEKEMNSSTTQASVTKSAEKKGNAKDKGKVVDNDETAAEVSSSSDGNSLSESRTAKESVSETKSDRSNDNSLELNSILSGVNVDKDRVKIGEADSVSNASTEQSAKQNAESNVTQELIEALIKKSLECGEGKKLFEERLIQKLGEALQAKKFKKIKKIFDSETESSDSSEEKEILELKKPQVRKKRRVIVSDSSDEESLADKLGLLNTALNNEREEKECEEVGAGRKVDDNKSSTTSKTDEDLPVNYNSDENNTPALNTNVKVEVTKLDDKEIAALTSQDAEDPHADRQQLTDSECANKTEEENKENAKKTTKTKPKRRNSFELLQENIRDMFICDDVITATGHRACRVTKESSCISTGAGQTQSNSTSRKSDRSSKHSEEISESSDSVSVNSKGKTVSTKSNVKSKRMNKTRQKECIESSDSEEDRPLALRAEKLSINSDTTRRLRKAAEKVQKNRESDTLRRSKRVLRKDSIKEPRVLIEKTDLTKIDSSRIMFDSSSDESFGIDVSELTAAVDISLHPEKPTDQEPAAVKKKTKAENRPRKLKKMVGAALTDDKTDDAMSYTDEESLTSDISMSSSVTSGKKVNIPSANTETAINEELLSDILVGLVSQKPTGQEEYKGDNKGGSDADVDDNEASTADRVARKSSIKKKKKRFNWQMGIILPKKRKKKTSVPLPSETFNTDVSVENINDASQENAGETKVQDTRAEDNSQSDPSVPVAEKNDALADEVQAAKKDSERDDPSTGSLPNETPIAKSSVKRKSKETNVRGNNTLVTQNNKDAKEAEVNRDVDYKNIDVSRLINYAWSGQERYKCLLCFFNGKNIVHHYKLSHPNNEVLISRLSQSTATIAISEAKEADFEKTCASPIEDKFMTLTCRFCYFSTEGELKDIVEAFYEHCTMHTGEYRFRCNNCPYQSVTKSSMKTHYYKVCRKFSDNCNDAIHEDEILTENGIYGYLCSSCNFVQLKRDNLEKHLKQWHENADAVAIKISMSVTKAMDSEDPSNLASEKTSENSQDSEVDKKARDDDPPVAAAVTKDSDKTDDTAAIKEDQRICPAADNNSLKETTTTTEESNAETSPDEEKSKSATDEADGPQQNGNLSVFVCPPELENKDAEIELERKKKMQEIIENMKLRRDVHEKGSSIIDRLRNKMDTVQTSSQISESGLPTNSPEESSVNFLASPTNVPISQDAVSDVEFRITNVCSLGPDSIVTNTDIASSTKEEKPDISSLAETLVCSLTDTKVKDPLVVVDIKKSENDVDMSDLEISPMENAAVYESDSSSEQSEGELHADVNTILKETSNIHASSRDPMMTTIQRLAAQLQNAKTLHPLPTDVGSPPEMKIKVEATSLTTIIPKAPDVVPIANIRRFGAKQGNDSGTDKTPAKNFIRLRRLSGDMLSAPVQAAGTAEDLLSASSEIDTTQSDKGSDILQPEAEEQCSFLKIENVVSLASTAGSNEANNPVVNDIKKVMENPAVKSKGVSLLKRNTNSPIILKKINAVAIGQSVKKGLQPGQENSADTIKLIPITNIAPSSSVGTNSPVTTSYVPIMPKGKIATIQVEPNKLIGIPINKDSIVQPITTRTISFTSATPATNLNYKIVKVVKTPSIIKPKEIPLQPVDIKMKSKIAYSEMLNTKKLSHLYKCMARDCSFTTDTVDLFSWHYHKHAHSDEKYASPPYDYQKCAYCHNSYDEWNQMRNHIDEKHAHCRYQCSYCFYRAITPYFVQLHQVLSHPGGRPNALTGKYAKPLPLKEDINRRDFVLPFVCHHDCGQTFYVPEDFIAHLKLIHNGNKITTFKCHLCLNTYGNSNLLVAHYKVHDIYKYQCLYCLSGTDTFNEMHAHLSLHHCNRLPQFLERSFTRQVVKNKDIIDQLTIRNVGMYLKHVNPFATKNDAQETNEDSAGKKDNIDYSALVVGNSGVKSNITLTVLKEKPVEAMKSLLTTTVTAPSSQQANSGVVTETTASTAGKQSLEHARHLNSPSVFPDNSSSGYKLLIEPLINQTPQTSVGPIAERSKNTTVTEGKDVNTKTDSASQQILQEPELALVSYRNEESNAVDPLGGSSNLDDEFININLLDNPEFVKNLNNRTDFLGVVENNTSKSAEKADDSDIEILDNIVADKAGEKDAQSAPKEKADSKALAADTSCPQKTNEKEQSVVCSSAENSNTSFDMSTCETSTSENGNVYNLLTLEDIKDTGLAGTMLYKCGYESCTFSALNANLLRSHMKQCTLGGENKYSFCTHCRKRFVKVGFLLEHLKVHGLKRFGCTICKMRYVTGFQATAHMRTKHKFANSKLVPADPKNPSADGLFVVQPVHGAGERKGKKRKGMKSADKDSEKKENIEKLSYGPDDIGQLPRQAIYNREVQCAICPYTTKVRTNIVRHLQLHAKDETVPESGPVNPVPCLDKKERMFDKMVNLASSSHQNGRMGGGKPKESTNENEDEFIPKFVPENKRYVCGVAECNYLTVDEAMLRYHLKALHSEEPYFKCPHCPQPAPGQEGQNVAIEKMGVHLKMHDTRLYKCSHCNHHHYHRHVVERHLSDKHPEKRPFVKVIRELEHADAVQQSPQEETDEEIPDPDGNHWKCNLCDYKCVYKAEMSTHAANVHDEKCQYKCSSCAFKTSGKILFEQHISSKHSTDPNADYVVTYQRIKGVNKKNVESTEQSQQDEPFDTTPLWRRDMPRIRHIRGILLEEEGGTRKPSEGSLKSSKRKSETEITPARPAKIKPGKSASLDDNKPSQEKSKRSLSCEKIPDNEETSGQKAPDANVDGDSTNNEKTSVATDLNDNNDSDMGQFGPYGKPVNDMFLCTLCNQYKSKNEHEMRDHLYKELNYVRWHCKECGYLTVNHNSLLNHCKKRHGAEKTAYQLLSPDTAIEEWVNALLSKQENLMRESSKQQSNGLKKFETQVQSIENVAKKSKKTVDLTNAISILKNDKDHDFNVSVLSDDDDEELIIDLKDVPTEKEGIEPSANKAPTDQISPKDEEKPFACKHCHQKFPRWRGLKLHVQVSHLKRLGYLCPYCDRSSNSETLLRHHIQAKHPGCEEKVIENVDSKGPELSNDFWEKEYGIILPKKSKKRKQRASEEGQSSNEKQSRTQSEAQEICTVCGFTAMNLSGLKVHMRRHTCKNYLKCVYCTFSGSMKAELHEHWQMNHPHLPFKIDDTSSSVSSPSKKASPEQQKKSFVTDYIDDIEEERVPIDGVIADTLIYGCFYCHVQSRSLSALKIHWNEVHNKSADSKNTPFKYKELKMPPSLLGKTVQCPVQGAESAIKAYKEHSQNSATSADRTSMGQKEGWICQWCDEFCESEINKKAHHNLFHSHKPMNFKRQGVAFVPEYICPECSLITPSIAMMRQHVVKHVNAYKCRHCDKVFNDINLMKNHHSTSHPGLEEKIDNIKDHSASIEKIMLKVMYTAPDGELKNLDDRKKSTAMKRPALAKKSTTKSIVRVRPSPTKIQAVARKSTNPLPRYPPGINFATDVSEDESEDEQAESKQFSFYGIPKAPIDLGRLNTYMVVGGHRMRVNCATLSQLININPRIVLHDVLKGTSPSNKT